MIKVSIVRRQALLQGPCVNGIESSEKQHHIRTTLLRLCYVVHCTQAEAAEEAPGAWCV